MKVSSVAIILAVMLIVPAYAQFNESIETNWDGVTARLEVLQQDNCHLYAQVVFENSGSEEARPGTPIYFKDIYLLDIDTDAKIFILQDANDRYLAGPVSDFNANGRWWVSVPPGGKVILWAMFPALDGDTEMIDLVIPEIFPFEGIEITRESFTEMDSLPTNLHPASANLVSARRTSSAVSVRLRRVNDSATEVDSSALMYRDAYLYDFRNGRKYPVLKDSEGVFVAEPLSDKNEGGRWWPSYMNKTGKALMYLKFQPPPDQVASVDIVIPKLVPFLNVQLPGNSKTSEHSGIEVRGVKAGIERVMQDLEAEETEEEIRIQLASEVLFDFDSYELKAEAESVLEKVLQVLGEYSGNSILVEGHTDSEGTEAYNQTLSENRANSVKTWLVEAGIESSLLQAVGYGESNPVASNETEEGRGKNRRVEITIKK